MRAEAIKAGFATYLAKRPCAACSARRRKTKTGECLGCRDIRLLKSEENRKKGKQAQDEYRAWRQKQLGDAANKRKQENAERTYYTSRLQNWRTVMDGAADERPRVNYGGENSYPNTHPYDQTDSAPMRIGNWYGLAQDMYIF